MSCERIQAQLRADAEPAPEIEEHLDACVDCAAVAAEVEGLVTDDGADLPEVAGLLGQVESAIAAERGPLAWLRERSTPVRLMLAVAIGFGIPLAFGIATLRADISVYPVVRFAAIGGAFAAALAAALWVGLRPLHRPGLSTAALRGLALFAVAAMVVSAAIPAAHAAHPASIGGVGDDLVRRALACFLTGLAVGVPVALAGRALGRAHASWLGAPAMAPLAGAVAGNLALHLHCPLVAPQHLLAGHAAVLVPFAIAIGWIALRWRRRGVSPAPLSTRR